MIRNVVVDSLKVQRVIMRMAKVRLKISSFIKTHGIPCIENKQEGTTPFLIISFLEWKCEEGGGGVGAWA